MVEKIEMSRVDTLPADLDESLLPEAIQEGFNALRWLRDDWKHGVNRFSEPGEAIYTARVSGRLAGVCGVNLDPFAGDAEIGRLRRLYVHPQFRRRGVGRRLVQHALNNSRGHFRRIRLRTLDESSAAFFEAIGFTKFEGDERCTHQKLFETSNDVI
jgi:N-acetylglutamate synthase-like GNAT family acetyltransferase